jgi:hypothetical protein
VQPVITDSARKHGIADEDILHAFRNPIAVHDEELTVFIGGDRAGNLIELGVVESQEGQPVIVHAMFAREKYLR